jgi:hypothetical protein
MGGKMKVVSVNSEELSGGIGRDQNAIDGNNKTIWQAEWYAPSPKHPHKLDIALGGTYEVWALRYLPS